MPCFDTVLFDLDGTLVDSNETIIRSYLHAFSVVLPNVRVTREDVVRQIGPPLETVFPQYTEDADAVRRLIDAYREHYTCSEASLTTLYPGVEETLRILHERRAQLAIVTTKRARAAWPGIRRFGLDTFVDVFVFLDDVAKPKPDPEPVWVALSRFKRVGKAVMVGDNQGDLIAAKRAGIASAGVAWSIKGAAHLVEVDPDIMLRSIEDILDHVDPCGKEL